MRWKIIVVNAGILLAVGLLAYTLLYTSLQDVLGNPSERKRALERSLRAARTELALDAGRLERWLGAAAESEVVRGLFEPGLRAARAEAATAEANRLRDAAASEPELAGVVPTLVVFVDERGIALARNASALMRGEPIGQAYPSLLDILGAGKPRSAVWHSRERQEQMLVSVAPVRGEGGRTLGAAIVGTALSDERMTRTREHSGGDALLFGVLGPGGFELLASSSGTSAAISALAVSEPVVSAARSAATSGGFFAADLGTDERVIGATPLTGYAGASAVLLGVAATDVATPGEVLTPLLGALLLGLLLVVVGGTLLGNYIAQPISELEDGLLTIINGQPGLRFQLDHEELGGLVFRINSLLNQLMGVPEDTTDEQGRPSLGPRAQDFQDALSVDESAVEERTDPAIAGALSLEPAEAYYDRLFHEYISAKRKLGDPTEHITSAAFRDRIRTSEREMSEKHGRPVRFQVQLRDQAIVLNAIPLGSSERPGPSS